MVMGDLVLFQDEVNPVMSVALDTGLEVTALHNHFFFDEPKVYFMHIGGEGRSKNSPQPCKAALDKVKEIRSGQSHARQGRFGDVPFAPKRTPSRPRHSKLSSAPKARPKTACSKSSSAAQQRCPAAAKSARRWA